MLPDTSTDEHRYTDARVHKCARTEIHSSHPAARPPPMHTSPIGLALAMHCTHAYRHLRHPGGGELGVQLPVTALAPIQGNHLVTCVVLGEREVYVRRVLGNGGYIRTAVLFEGRVLRLDGTRV